MSVYVYVSFCDFVCIALLLPFILGFCPFFWLFFVFSIVFSTCYHWWICLLSWLLSSFFLFLNYFFIFNNIFFYFYNFYFIFLSFFFLSPFSSEPCGWQGLSAPAKVRPEPLRWESRAQDIGPPETSQPHVISNGERSPRDLHLNAKTQLDSKTSKLQCWTHQTKQLARQKHNPTH